VLGSTREVQNFSTSGMFQIPFPPPQPFSGLVFLQICFALDRRKPKRIVKIAGRFRFGLPSPVYAYGEPSPPLCEPSARSSAIVPRSSPNIRSPPPLVFILSPSPRCRLLFDRGVRRKRHPCPFQFHDASLLFRTFVDSRWIPPPYNGNNPDLTAVIEVWSSFF